MRKKSEISNTGGDEIGKVAETNNKPPRELRRFIKLSNLVPNSAEIDFYAYDLKFTEEEFENPYLYFVSNWSEKHNLRQYPKLFRYLAFLAKRGTWWQSAFHEFKEIRRFIIVFVEITEMYQEVQQKKLECLKMLEDKRGSLPNFLYETSTDLYTNITGDFHLYYGQERLRQHLSPDKMSSLAINLFDRQWKEKADRLSKELFEITTGFVSLKMNENHKGNISVGRFSDIIEETDFRRFKKCLACSNAFWAYRLNAKFCSKKCSNKYYQRQLRANPERREERNFQRKKTYQSKKEQKIGKGKSKN